MMMANGLSFGPSCDNGLSLAAVRPQFNPQDRFTFQQTKPNLHLLLQQMNALRLENH